MGPVTMAVIGTSTEKGVACKCNALGFSASEKPNLQEHFGKCGSMDQKRGTL